MKLDVWKTDILGEGRRGDGKQTYTYYLEGQNIFSDKYPNNTMGRNFKITSCSLKSINLNPFSFS